MKSVPVTVSSSVMEPGFVEGDECLGRPGIRTMERPQSS